LQRGIQTNGQVIALHVNPRFDDGRVIVLNSHDNGWYEEKRFDGARNPFYPGGQFMLTVRRQADHFNIFVNGVHLENFKHRMSPDMVDAVYIEGDVIVDRVLATLLKNSLF
jgi:Galactoside-binding lectin